MGTEISAPPAVDVSLDREQLVVFNCVVWWFELLPSACLYELTELKQGRRKSSLPELSTNSAERPFSELCHDLLMRWGGCKLGAALTFHPLMDGETWKGCHGSPKEDGTLPNQKGGGTGGRARRHRRARAQFMLWSLSCKIGRLAVPTWKWLGRA